ncbi:MAG: hypothetical protein LBO80_03360 [Treponema sp.]|nr:hypothetical protein [Treponema sp.]
MAMPRRPLRPSCTGRCSAGGPAGAALDYYKRAFERGDDAALDRFFAAEPAHIREGDAALADLWTAREVRRRTAAGITGAEEQVRRSLAAGELEPPREIDFRMYTTGRAELI